MKHLFKKGLSLLLAVLMVTSMLPMSTLAAAVTDGWTAHEDGVYSNREDVDLPEAKPSAEIGEDITDPIEEVTPPPEDVTDDGADITDPAEEAADPAEDDLRAEVPMGEDQDGDRPEKPGGGDEEPDVPADPLWINLPLDFTIDQAGNFTIKVTANGNSGGGGSGQVGFAVVLDRAGPSGVSPEQLINLGGISGDTSSDSAMRTALAATRLPGTLYTTGGDQPFDFALDGSYNGEVLVGSLGSFQDFLAEAVKIDPSLSGEIPLRVILVTSDGGVGVSHKAFPWKAGKDAVLQAESLNGGSGIVPGDGYIRLTTGKTGNIDFDVVPIKVIQDATITIMDVVYKGTDEDNITMSWPEGAGWPSGLDVNDPDTEGYDSLRMTIDQYNAWSHPSGLIEGTITITYVVDGVAGTKTLEIPVTTEQTATKIEITVARGATVQGGSTTVTNKLSNKPASLVDISTFEAAKDILGGSAMIPSDFKEKVQPVTGVNWSFIGELPSYKTDSDWDDEAWAPGSADNFMPAGGTASYSDLVEVSAAGDAPLGTHYVGDLVLPWVDVDADEDAEWMNGLGAVSIPVFVTVIEGETVTTTVVFDPKDGTAATVLDGEPGTTATPPTGYTAGTTIKTISGASYVFKGWSTSNVSVGASATTTSTFKFPDSGTNTYYGVWAPMYTVTYANAGGSYPSITVPADSNSPYESGSTVTVLAASGLAVGDEMDGGDGKVYAFKGWDLSGTKYYPSETNKTFDITANTTLTASWEEVKYTVKYDGNGETMTNAASFPDETGLSNGASTTKANGTPTATGKTFAGWAKSATGAVAVATGNQYTVAKADADANHVITLYAKWSTNTYTVTFDPNTGTWSDSASGNKTTQGEYADKVTAPTATVSKTGYNFGGWFETDNTGALTSTQLDTTSHTYGVKDGMTYKAKWDAKDVTVKYVAVHGTNPADETVKFDTKGHNLKASSTITGGTWSGNVLTVTESGATHKYRFDGWARTGTTAVTQIDIDVEGPITVTAMWTEIFTITYANPTDTTPGSITAKTVDEADGATHAVLGTGGNAPTPTTSTGYTFVGWSATDDSDAGTATYTAAGTTSFKVTGNVTLYPVWSLNKHTLKYDMQGHGTGSKPADSTQNYGASVTLSATPAVNSKVTESNIHWVFGGWSETAGGTAVASITMPDADKTVYAIWSKDTHTVTYNGNSGTLDATHVSATVTCGNSYTIPSALPTRTGFTFGGWKDGDGNSYSAGGSITAVTKDTVLTAQWTQGQSSIVYNWQDPTSKQTTHTGNTSATDTAVPGASSADKPAYTGYTWDGKWYAEPGCTTQVTTFTYPAAVGDSVNYYAKWTVNSHKVTYDKNNGPADAVVPGVVNTTYGATVTVGTATTATAGWTFKGWSRSSGNQTVSDVAASTITMADADITLYAQWEVDVTFQVNGGTWSDSTNTDIVKSGQPGASGLSAPTGMTRAGHDFSGWSPTLPAGGNFPTAPATYVAQWTVKQYTVAFLWNTTANSHTLLQQYDTTKGNYGAAITKPTSDPSMTGYTFGGWYKEAACTNAMSASDTYPANNDLKMYAKWTANKYEVTYDAGVATGASIVSGKTPQEFTYDAASINAHTAADAITGTATGWTFKNWLSNETGNPTYNGGATLNTTKKTAGFALTAQWQVKVTYDANYPTGVTSGATIPSPVDLDYNGSLTSTQLATPGDLTDYTWASWNTEADGSGTTVSTSTKFTEPTTIYAQWTEKTYSYIFNPNSGAFGTGVANDGSNYKVTGKVGTTITAPSDPTRANYTFKGWATDNTNDTSKIITPATAMPSGVASTTIYAVWTANTYGYVFDPNGGAFAAGVTGLQGDGTVKLTGTAGFTVTAPTSPTQTDYKFDAWYTAATGGNKVTTHTITGNAADGTVTNTVYAHWIPLYDVTYVANGHGTVDTSKNVVDHEAWTYTVLDGSEVLTTGGTWSGSYFTDAAGKHWKFNGWLSSADGKTYNKGGSFAVSEDITLTAQWDEYYLVTLAPPVVTDTSTVLGDHVTVKFDGASKDSSAALADRRVWVKIDTEMAITDLTLKANANNYIFAKWTQDQTGATAGTFAAATGATAATTGFTPKADTVLTANYWRKPVLKERDSYHQNFATDAAVAANKWGGALVKANNTLPTYTWTKNNATLASSDELQIELTSGTWTTLNVATTAGTGVDVVKSTDASGNVTYTFQRDYLMSLVVPMGDTCKVFNIRVQSNTPDTSTTNAAATPLTAKLEIAVNPDPLTKVDIQAKTANGDLTVTANVESASGRDQVEYYAHTPTTIDKDNKLTYTWYYGPTKPTQGAYSGASAANNATNITNAKNNVSGTEITGVTGPTVDVKDPKYKGMYIYAVVAASNTGYGAVITNSIAVDYDATVTVKKDTVAVSAATGYTVYLLEKKDGNADGYATMPTGVKATTWNDTNKYFETTNSALTGGVTYDVYVNKVEGDTSYYVKTGQTVSPTSQSATVNFYSVNAVATDLKHAKDNAGADVGEDFTGANAAPTSTFTTTGAGTATITVGDTEGVFTGSKVTAAASKTWGQDYWWNWQSNATGTFTSYGTERQASGATGKEYTISAKTYIGGQMEQKTYTVKGNVWALGGNGNAGVKDPRLTANGHSFNGTWGTNGKHTGVATFTVPKSGVPGALNSENYVISATPFDGTETGLGTVATTTLVKYAEYIDVAAASTNDAAVNAKNPLTGGTIAQITANNNGAFTIVVTASNWILRVQDNDGSKAVDQTATHTTAIKAANGVTKVDNAATTTTWTKTFANYASDQKVYNVTVSNPGNTDLKVTLVVKKTVGSTTTTVYDGSATVTTDTANSVAFTDLTQGANSFDLAAAGTTTASKVFTVTLPNDLDNNDDVTYSFEFTSKDANDATIYGPSITYNLKLVIDPIPVKSVGIKDNGDGTFSADALTFDATNAPLNAGSTPTLTTANDLTYQWYVGTQPQLNATTGAITNASSLTAATGSGNATATYTPAASDAGKTLWLVVSGKNNASMAAEASVAAPYRAAVTIMENTTATTDYGSYKVYLVPTSVTNQPTDWTAAGIVEATHKPTDAQGVFTTDTVLVAGTKYNVWTNVVKGTTNADYKNSGELSAISTSDPYAATKTVTYYSVTVNETTYDNTYTGLTGAAFFGTGAATGNTGITATAAAGTSATAVTSGNWVVSGTDVTLNHAAWGKDYTLAWTGATKQGTDAAGGGSSAKITAIGANTTVDAKLTLTLYDMTAYVTGKGTVSEIKLTGPVTITSTSSTSAGNSVAFKLPAGDYALSTTQVSGTDLVGYRAPYVAADTSDPTAQSLTVKAGKTGETGVVSSLEVKVSASGRVMVVADNAGTVFPVNNNKDQSGTATYKDGAVSDPFTIPQVITLPYGYTAGDVTLTVENNGESDLDILNAVTMETTTPFTNNKITVSDAAASTPVKLDGSENLALNATTTATLSIAAGLDAGSYTGKLTFSFLGEAGNNASKASVIYDLTVVVEPAEFTAVSITKASGTAADIGNGTKVEFGESLLPYQYTTTAPDLWQDKGITAGTDYTYTWYATPADKTLTGSWAGGTFTPATTASATKLDPKTGTYELEGSTIAQHPGERIWLVVSGIKAKGAGTNVIEAAISNPVTTGFQPVVKISEDGTTLTADPGANTYVVTISDGTTPYNTVWDATAGGFVPVGTDGTTKVSLDATQSYTASVNKYKGASSATADMVAQTTLPLTLANPTRTVPYFTVNAVETKAFEAISGLGEDFGGDDKRTGPAVSFTLGGATLADGTPVLSGQSVVAKTETWTQDYKLTWYTKMDATATVPTRDTSYEGTTPAMTARGGKVDSTSALGTGYTVTSVTNKLYVGGRLDQNTYTIAVTVAGTGSVASVATTQTADSTVTFTGTNDDAHANNLFDQGDTMTFTVVAGNYDIAATQGPSTNIVSIKWESETAQTGNKLTNKNVAKNPDKATYSVVINIESASLNLTVSDDKATPNKASSGIGDSNSVTNAEVRYFSGIPANDKLVLSLTNSGNKPLDTTMTVYRFDKTASIPSYSDATKWGTGATGYLASAPATAGDLADTLFQNETRQVITVTGVMADGTTVVAKAGSDAGNPAVTAGTITIGPGAFNKDDGVYVFRFVGDDKDAATDNPVVYYVLDLTIQPLPITGVTTDTPATAPGAGDKVQLQGATDGTTGGFNNVMVDPDGNGSAASVAASTVADPALVDGTDVKYQWVRTATSMTSDAVKALLTVNATSGAISSTDTSKVTLLTGNGANTKQYTLQDVDMDGYLYLVAYAPGASVNASSHAVSPAIKTKRTVGVQITLDGSASTNIQPTSGTDDPGYVIYLVEDTKGFNATNAATGTDGTWATTWSNNSDKMYQAAIDVDNITYRVYAPSYKGSTNYVDTGLTLGKQTSGDPVIKVQVPYFSVRHTTNLTVTNTHDGFSPYLPSSNTTNKADNQVQGALTVAVSDDRNSTAYTKGTVLTTDNVPVLKDMNVKVTVDATKTSNNASGAKNTWSDAQPYHTLSASIDGNSTNWTGTTTGTGIAYAATITGVDIKVDAAKNFAAKLEQVLFDVTFQVKDITPAGTTPADFYPGVDTVELRTDGTKEPAAESKSFSGTVSNGTDGNKGTDGASVTFQKVPAGHLEIQVTNPQNRTNVNGYTWRAADADVDTVFPGDIVEVTAPNATDGDLNQHASGNNNIIQVEYSSNAVRWFDNFNTADGSLLKEEDGTDKFVQSAGFQKVDKTGGPYLALTEGYSTANGDVLTYTVQVRNTGANILYGFRIAPNNANLEHTLATAKIYAADGTVRLASQDVTAGGFDLGQDEIVEFQVTIPAKQASNTPYATTFTVSSDNPDPVSGNSYSPAYQVKPVIELQPGNATVIYGNDHFEATPVDVAPANKNDGTWDNAVYTTTFTYELVQLDGANDATILADLNKAMGLSLTTLAAKPAWVSFDTTTGAVTFDSSDGKRATDVNVQVKTATDFDSYTANEVDDELVLYIKAVDLKNPNDVYYTTYTVNVEPGQLKIVGGSFTPATTIGGQLVDKSEFTYDQVDNQMDEAVVPTAAITGNDTAKGNTTAQDGTVNVNNVHTATWTVAPERYVSELATQHTFTVTYKPLDNVEKWNYKPDTYTKTITASKPALGLTFGDVLGKSDIEQADAELKIGRATDEDAYSEILTDNAPYAPEAMEHTKETYRKGEYIVYLDTEPKYTVTLTATGNLHDVTVDEELVGFKVVKGDLSFTTLADGEKKVFELELDMVDGKWVGEHTAKYTVTGTGDSGDTTSATYELVFTVIPKTIPKAHVTELTDPWPDQQPDKTVKVTGEDPTDPDKDVELDKWKDKHDNHPIKPPVVTVTPDETYKDGKDYTVTVELTADPNYTFEDETPEEPNYTAGDEGPDDEYDVTVKPDPDPTKENEKVTFTKTTPLPKRPELKFEDVNANNARDVVEPSPEAVRPTITIMKGQALGKYIISLGAYGETVTGVDITQTGAMPNGSDWVLEPASVDYIYDVESDTAGDKKVDYTLDMTGVDTSKLAFGTYTMTLRAEGKNAYGEDVSATYTIAVQVDKAPAGELRFDDVKTGGDTKDPDALGPDKELKRLERLENPENPEPEYKPYEVVKGDKLGTYTINLGAYGNTVNDVTVTETELKLPDGTVWTLDPVSIATLTPGGDKTTYILDLKDVDTAAAELGVYTLKLKAEGTDINGDKTEATYEIAIEVVKAPAPVLMFDDVNADRPTDVTAPAVDAKRNISQSTNAKLGKYIINLGSYGGTTSGIKFTEVLTDNFIGVYGVSPDCEALAPVTLTSVELGGGKQAFELDLSGMDTKTAGTYTLTITAKGVDINGDSVEATYTLTITLRAPGGGGGGGSPECPKQVTYLLGLYGTTTDSTMEMVSGSAVKNVPNVNAVAGYKFLGWSLIGPSGNMEQDAKRTVVDPKTVTITKDTVFYAVYQPVYAVPQPPIHKHYVIGYPNGNFGPADNIDRASVATIIARAVLPNFVEGADYGNPGGYTDVSGHWAASAIAYCSKYGVFKGYEDGTFKPSQPISRQELALVMARLNGVQTGGSVPFTDIGEAGAWAVDGIYTAYINGWVNGYTDGTFKPVNPIRRDETVKIFNAYLGRGVNAEGLEGLSEYVHSGVASNNTEDGTSQYMTWPDVTKDQWAYYEIIEAANDHEFTVDSTLPRGYAVPETWTKCWIDEKWRYHDDANDGGPSAVAEALPSESGLDD